MPSTPISLAWSRRTESPSLAISTHDLSDDTRRVRIYDGATLEFKATERSEDGSGRDLPSLTEHRPKGEVETMMSCMDWVGDGTSHLLACV